MVAEDVRGGAKPRGITVVLDANALISDFRLEGASSIALLSHSALRSVDVGVPQVALEEAINNYRDEAFRAATDLGKLRQLLKRIGMEAVLQTENIDELVASYEGRIRKRLKKYGARTLAYPDVTHERLAHQAIAKRSPFDQQGRGYRDALIWHTVIDLVGDREVWLVTGDNHFRAPGSDELASGLVEDLTAVNRKASDVRIFRTIADCVTELIQVIEQPKVDVSQRLREDARYLQVVINALKDDLRYKRLDQSELEHPSSLADEATIDFVEDIGDIRVEDARLVATGEVLVRLDALVDVTVGLIIEKSEVAAIEEEEEYEDDAFEIDSGDWSPRYVSAHTEARLYVELSAIVDRESLDIQKIDVDGFSVN